MQGPRGAGEQTLSGRGLGVEDGAVLLGSPTPVHCPKAKAHHSEPVFLGLVVMALMFPRRRWPQGAFQVDTWFIVPRSSTQRRGGTDKISPSPKPAPHLSAPACPMPCLAASPQTTATTANRRPCARVTNHPTAPRRRSDGGLAGGGSRSRRAVGALVTRPGSGSSSH